MVWTSSEWGRLRGPCTVQVGAVQLSCDKVGCLVGVLVGVREGVEGCGGVNEMPVEESKRKRASAHVAWD